MVADSWSHIFVFPLPPKPTSEHKDLMMALSNNASKLLPVHKANLESALHMIQYANRALQDLYDVIPEMQSASTRSSHGLCDACATYVFGPLFNLASKTDIQRVADLVRQSQRSSMRALSQFQKGEERFTSFAAVTNQKFETLQHMVSAQHTLMSQLQRKVSAEIADIQVELQTQLDFIQQLASFVLELADIQEICSALIHLKHFALTNNLVP
jgi:hypothetical protein